MWGAVYQAALRSLVYGCLTHQNRCGSRMDGRMAASGTQYDRRLAHAVLT